ncbi:MAG: hypothetical protein Q7S27_00345 [Nanoarchaeota archaeon]|nr:hypothetical protein [Nanoarchaeota archaeon]
MEKRFKVITTFTLAVLLIVVLYNFSDWFSKTTGYLINDDPTNDLARCLTDGGAKFYGSKTCPDCNEQKEIFGAVAFKLLDYIDCSKEPIECSNIKSVPAWEINYTMHYGTKSLNDLKVLSKCYK